MAKDYTVKGWEPWREADGTPITDQHGNTRGTVSFVEDDRRVDGNFKKEPEIGEKRYGDIEAYTTRSGSSRVKWKAAQKAQFGGSTGQGSGADSDFGYRCNALNNAVAHVATHPEISVLGMADEFYRWLTKAPVPSTQSPEASKERDYQEQLAQELNETFPPEG